MSDDNLFHDHPTKDTSRRFCWTLGHLGIKTDKLITWWVYMYKYYDCR